MTNKLQSPFGDQGWYENNSQLLYQQIKNTLNEADKVRAAACIVPHAGLRWCGDVIGSVMSHLDDRYTNIIVIGPSHRVKLDNMIICCNYMCITTPLGDCEIRNYNNIENQHVSNKIHENEHSVQIMIPHIQCVCPSSTITPLIVGSLDSKTKNTLITNLIDIIDDQTLLMISSDFTHYGTKFNYTPYAGDNVNIHGEIEKFDKYIIDMITSNNRRQFDQYIDSTKNTICGKVPISVMMGVLEQADYNRKLCSYSTSAALTKQHNNSVSYAGILIHD